MKRLYWRKTWFRMYHSTWYCFKRCCWKKTRLIPLLSPPVVIGNFNARSSKWWIDDKTTQEGLKIENLLSQFSLSQVINEPTHISQNFNSCIDLLFTNQQNLITDSGIHPSLHSNCHHQIIYGKFNLKIFYPPPYERHI